MRDRDGVLVRRIDPSTIGLRRWSPFPCWDGSGAARPQRRPAGGESKIHRHAPITTGGRGWADGGPMRNSIAGACGSWKPPRPAAHGPSPYRQAGTSPFRGRPDGGAAECGLAEQIAGRFVSNPLAMLRMAHLPLSGGALTRLRGGCIRAYGAGCTGVYGKLLKSS